jgi:2-polyprenyl-3-methyl-5-hydroxy-6-metoxy-1,4-benzoquinol methylase
LGHLLHKYTRDYFLGGTDAVTGRSYGVLGHEEYKAQNIHQRHREEFDFTIAVAGGIENKDILEIGFGRGDHIPLFLNEEVRTYYGIDFSPDSLDLARQHQSDPRVRLELIEGKDLGEQEKFDVIAMYDVLEHIPAFEVEVLWRKFRRVLRAGGVIIISTPIFATPNMGDHTELNPSVMGIHCNKQSVGTLVRTGLNHGFIVAQNTDRFFGLVRGNDLSTLTAERSSRFAENHRALLTSLGIDDGVDAVLGPQTALLVPPPGRLLIGCVAENTPKFLSQAMRLVQSVRWFGGSIAGANIMVCIVDEADRAWVEELRRWGAFVRIVPRFSLFCLPSNKLRLLEIPELFAYDTVILMDCDTLVVQDPTPHLASACFQARIADGATVTAAAFDGLFSHYRLGLPEQRYQCTFTRQPTIWYCNTGVLVFPKNILSTIYPAWRQYTIDLVEKNHLLGVAPHFCEQASLTLAYHSAPVPFAELPVEMNYPLHRSGTNAPAEITECDPVIIHYHHLVDSSGYIEETPSPLAQKRIHAFNERLRNYRRRDFNNRCFWDLRCAEHPGLGSDVGSQEQSLVYKRQILRELVDGFKPESILDIGCGDQQVTNHLPDEKYFGVDISSVAIERNRIEHPRRTYLAGDFVDMALPAFDLTICLDVVIHLGNLEAYKRFVQRVVATTRLHGVISGFETPPSPGSEITFFHEPLSTSLMMSGAKDLKQLGRYGDVVVWLFTRDGTAGQATVTPEQASMDRGGSLPPSWTSIGQAGQQAKPAPLSTRWPAYSYSSPGPLSTPTFVVGCMRSGTTLLAQLLGAHPDIVYCPFELKDIWSRVGGVPMASPKTHDRVCPQLGSADARPQVTEHLTQAFANEYRKNSANKNALARFLSKNPHLCNKLPFVDATFNNQVQFIWIHRQLPQVVTSLQRLLVDIHERHALWHYWPPKVGTRMRCWHCFDDPDLPQGIHLPRCFPGGDIRFLAEYWLETNRAVSSFFKLIPPARALVVKEEQLIADPEQVIAQCLAFLEVPLDISILKGFVIDRARNAAWTEHLSDQDRRILLEFVKENGRYFDEVFPDENMLQIHEEALGK